MRPSPPGSPLQSGARALSSGAHHHSVGTGKNQRRQIPYAVTIAAHQSGSQDSNLRPLVPQTSPYLPMRSEFDLECFRQEMVGMTTSARYGFRWNRVDIMRGNRRAADHLLSTSKPATELMLTKPGAHHLLRVCGLDEQLRICLCFSGPDYARARTRRNVTR